MKLVLHGHSSTDWTKEVTDSDYCTVPQGLLVYEGTLRKNTNGSPVVKLCLIGQTTPKILYTRLPRDYLSKQILFSRTDSVNL